MEKLVNTDCIDDFNKTTLLKLKPYFDLSMLDAHQDDVVIWYNNLLTLAQHSLGVAHCVQHNHIARTTLEATFKNKPLPDFYKSDYEQQIGCYSNIKGSDKFTLENNIVNGTKHWITNIHQAEYGIFRIQSPDPDKEAYVLFDFSALPPNYINDCNPRQIGMEIAKAGSLVVNNYSVPEGYVLGYRDYYQFHPEFSFVSNFTDYAFITNYLGLIIALYKDIETYAASNNIVIELELKNLGVEVSSLVMTWQHNLESVVTASYTDEFWGQRDTQYVRGKQILLSLIQLALKIGNSQWLDATGAKSQRLRDALVFVTHMKPIYQNLKGKNFVKF